MVYWFLLSPHFHSDVLVFIGGVLVYLFSIPIITWPDIWRKICLWVLLHNKGYRLAVKLGIKHMIHHTDFGVKHLDAMFRSCTRDPLIDTRGKLEEPDKWKDFMKSQWGTHCLVCAWRNSIILHQSSMVHLKMPKHHISWFAVSLTHLPLDKMAAISQTMFSDAFPWMKICVLLTFHWSLYIRVQLTITQHWFR